MANAAKTKNRVADYRGIKKRVIMNRLVLFFNNV